MAFEKLARLPNFLKRFGPVEGLRLGLGVTDRGGIEASAAEAVRVPGFHNPIWLRPTRSDYSIFWQSIVRKQYDIAKFAQAVEIDRRAKQMVRDGKVPVILDCGANIGLSLRTLAKDFPFAHVVAVEPDTDNMRVLQANAKAMATPHTLVQGAVAGSSGHCRVVARERGSAGLMTQYCDGDDADAIRAYTVPELVAMVPNGAPWIVKLDIEGAQDELFSHNIDWVADAELIILELDDWAFPWGGTSVNFFRALANFRFDYLLDDELILAFRHR